MRGNRARVVDVCGVFGVLLCCAAPACAAETVPAADNAPAPARFFIQAFDVSGVTALPAAAIEALVYPHEGPDRTQADVEAARKAIQDAYTARGFGAVVVDIPVQQAETFSAGIVQIAVNEVPVGQVRVVGARFHSLWVARQAVPALVEGQPVNLQALQTQVSAANRFPDRSLDPQFKPGRAPGEIDVDLKMTDEHPLHASAQIDNDASPSTRPLRVTATARYTDLFQAGQAATFTYVVAPLDYHQTQVFAGSYTIPVLGTPWSVSLSAYHSNSNVASLGGSAVLGNGFQVGMRALYHLPATGTSQSLSFGADFKDFKQNIVVSGGLASAAPVRYIPVELQYALAGASEHSSYDVSLGSTLGLRVIHGVVCVPQTTGCVIADAFQNREQYSYENFVRVNFAGDYNYAFGKDFVLAARISGQLADSHLVTNEQVAGGGMQTVRGYYSSEAVGDNGIEPSLELRWPSLASWFGTWMTELRPYTFADAAFLHVDAALAGQHGDYRMIGVGSGLRLRLFGKLSGDFLAALPLTNGPVTVRRHARVNFQIKGDF
jgi:hemolysin activation/secretion protein